MFCPSVPGLSPPPLPSWLSHVTSWISDALPFGEPLPSPHRIRGSCAPHMMALSALGVRIPPRPLLWPRCPACHSCFQMTKEQMTLEKEGRPGDRGDQNSLCKRRTLKPNAPFVERRNTPFLLVLSSSRKTTSPPHNVGLPFDLLQSRLWTQMWVGLVCKIHL